MTVGILGAGQLGRMLALAGYPLGLRFRFFDPNPESPARDLAPLTVASFDDSSALAAFAQSVDILTLEFENIPVIALEIVQKLRPLAPCPQALEISQDRLYEKNLCQALKIPTPANIAVETKEQLLQAVQEIGFPCVLKTRRLGYDGKGQKIIRAREQVDTAFQALAGSPLILEAFIPFTREVSQIIARNKQGEIAYYPLSQNVHRDGILWNTIAPAPDAAALIPQAQDYTTRIARKLQYTGVLAVEYFVHNGELIFNEMAPRVHNSGHWTIEGANCSQFENHVRAVCGLPLGNPNERGAARMFNILSTLPDTERMLAIPGAHVHLYGKAERPGRKLGHVTLCEQNAAQADELARQVESLLK
ncbi:MAG: 5-(carboxyamino)imidazole ribonucleotide synthase [Oligoflexia bacterium]|nr:5-(carboxyamino)imidazole ribonucleotide synthase [Oligoflexia bacterium]